MSPENRFAPTLRFFLMLLPLLAFFEAPVSAKMAGASPKQMITSSDEIVIGTVTE